LRILLTVEPDIPVPPKLYGGIERIVDGLIRELRCRGHEIGLLANPESECAVDYFIGWPGSTSHKKGDTIRNTSTLLRAVREFRPNLVHSFARLMYLLPLLARKIPKLMSYQRGAGGKQIRIASKLGGGSVEFTGCSEYVAGMGRTWGSHWTAIPNFVDTDFFRFQPTVADDAPLVFLSRIERIKGAHTAIALARKSGRRLILAGNRVTHEEGEAYWKGEIEPFVNKDGIEYVGPVSDEQKNDLLGSAAAMVVPIEWDEPFGMVFPEALACGTPVISCPRGALPEIVNDGEHGFLIRSFEEGVDAICRLGEIKRSECRRRAEERFSRKVVVGQYETLYARLVNGGGHS
jgi:glycosyltransferase involved in cell wall biosynthesis